MMKENELELMNNVRVRYGKKNKKVYRGNRPLLCKECITKYNYPVKTKKEQMETAEKGVQFIYKDNKLICPNCNREISILKDYSQWKEEEAKKLKEERKNIHLILMGHDWECGLKFYGLSCRLEHDDWMNVGKYFKYYHRGWSRDQELEWYGHEPFGWLTQNPVAVEKALGIREDLTLEHRKKVKEEERKKRREEMNHKNELKEKIISYFMDNGDRPFHKVLSDIDGEVFEPKDYKWDIYGGGYKFIINPSECWFIQNNGHDGDDWGLNNIETGGAGAIGWVVSFDSELADLIEEYCRL